MKIKALAILICAASLFAEGEKAPTSCKVAFDAIKNTYPRDASANRIYAMANARMLAMEKATDSERSKDTYAAELKNCNLAVEIFKTQLSNAALRKSLDSLVLESFAVQKQISETKDSLINLWTKSAGDAKSISARLEEEYSRLERINKQNEANAIKDSIEKARLSAQLAVKDSLLAAQRAEAQKKLDAMNSKTISVFKDARGTILSMSDILFEIGKADLKPELKENLAAIGAILQSLLTESKVSVEGHTDNVGTPEFNQKLSEQRAKSVMQYLIERGIEAKRLQAVGHGSTKPVADNGTKEGQAKNRRVELVIKD
jgi:outer membrane protein OmpA-like peptidoglycan-associated protein